MLRVTGVVTQVEAGVARIECSPAGQPACATCATGRGCGWQRSSQARRIELNALQGNCQLQAGQLEAGQTLELEVDEGRLLRAACRLYLPPLAGLLAGPALLRMAGLEQGVLPFAAACAGLGLGAAVAWRWTRDVVPIRWRGVDAATFGAGPR
jgi:positive regulator of sigma E activity